MYQYASFLFVLLFAEMTVLNTQPPLISTLVLQNDLLVCTNTRPSKYSNPVEARYSPMAAYMF